MFNKVIYEASCDEHNLTIDFIEMLQSMIQFMEYNKFEKAAVGYGEEKRIVTVDELKKIVELCEHFIFFGNYIELTKER